MIVKTFSLGLIGTNAYLLIDEESKEAVLIDLGGDYHAIKDELEKNNASLKYILNTHGHFDHILGERDAQEVFGVPVYVHEEDKYLVENLPKQLERFGFVENALPPENLKTFSEKDTFKIGDKEIKVLHTPGHTPGSVCFLAGKLLFSGDTLFYTSVGRTDFEGGSFAQLSNSIKEKLFKLDDDIDVYPGHDSKTSIGYEKKYNCYFGSNNI